MASWAETSLKFIVTFQATALFSNLAKVGNAIEKVDKQGKEFAKNLEKGLGSGTSSNFRSLQTHLNNLQTEFKKLDHMATQSGAAFKKAWSTGQFDRDLRNLGTHINAAGQDIRGMSEKVLALHANLGKASAATKQFESSFRGQLSQVEHSLGSVENAYKTLQTRVEQERHMENQWADEKARYNKQQLTDMHKLYEQGQLTDRAQRHAIETEIKYNKAVQARLDALRKFEREQTSLGKKQTLAHSALDEYTRKVDNAVVANKRLHSSFQRAFHAANTSANGLIASLSTVVLYAQQAANVYQQWGLNVNKMQGISGMSSEQASSFLGTGKYLGIDENVMITSYRYAMKNTQTAISNFQKTLQKQQLADMKAQQRIQDVQFANSQSATKRQMALEMKQAQISNQQANAYWAVRKAGESDRVAQERASISAQQAAVLQAQNKAGRTYKIVAGSPTSAATNASYLAGQLSLNNAQQRASEAQRSSIEKNTLSQNMRNLNMDALTARLARQAATGQLSWDQAVKKAQMGAEKDAYKLASAQRLADLGKQQQQYNYSPDVSALMSIGILKPGMTKAMIPDAKTITNELIKRLPELPAPERMKIMQKFFGRGAGSMIRYFMTSESEKQQIAKELGDAGLIMRKKDMASWKDFYGQLRIMQIRWMGIQIAFTRALVPIITQLIPKMKPILTWFQQHANLIVKIIGALGVYAVAVKAVGGAMVGLSAAAKVGNFIFDGTKVAAAAKGLFGVKTVLSGIGTSGVQAVERVGGKFTSLSGIIGTIGGLFSNPVTGIIAVIIAAAGAAFVLYKAFKPFHNAVDGVLRSLHLMKPATVDVSRSMQFSRVTPSVPGSKYVTSDTAGFAGAQQAWRKKTGLTVQTPSEYLTGLAQDRTAAESVYYAKLIKQIESKPENRGITPANPVEFLSVAEKNPAFRLQEQHYNTTAKVTLMPVGNKEFYKLMQMEAMKTGKILVSVKDTAGVTHFAKILEESNRLAQKDMAAQQHQKTMQNIMNTALGWNPESQLQGALVVSSGYGTRPGGVKRTGAGRPTYHPPTLNKATIKRLAPYIAQLANAPTESMQFQIVNSVAGEDRLTMMAMMQYLNVPGQQGIDNAKNLMGMLVDRNTTLGLNTYNTATRMLGGQSTKVLSHTPAGVDIFDKQKKDSQTSALAIVKSQKDIVASSVSSTTGIVKDAMGRIIAYRLAGVKQLVMLNNVAAELTGTKPYTDANFALLNPYEIPTNIGPTQASAPHKKKKPTVVNRHASGTYTPGPQRALIGEKGPEFVFNREQMYGLREMFGEIPTGASALKNIVKQSVSEILLPGRKPGTGALTWNGPDYISGAPGGQIYQKIMTGWKDQYYAGLGAAAPMAAPTSQLPAYTAAYRAGHSGVAGASAAPGQYGTVTSTAGGSSSGGMTRASFATSLLSRLGIPASKSSVAAIQRWELQEGGGWDWAKYNPLNTTWKEKDSTSGNSVGVQIYTSWQEGLNATVKTLKNGYYSSILSALQSGDEGAIYSAINNSSWGTHGLSSGAYIKPTGKHVDIQGGPKDLAAMFHVLLASGGLGATEIAHGNMGITPGRPYPHRIPSVPGGSHMDHIHMGWGNDYGKPEILRAGSRPGTGRIDTGLPYGPTGYKPPKKKQYRPYLGLGASVSSGYTTPSTYHYGYTGAAATQADTAMARSQAMLNTYYATHPTVSRLPSTVDPYYRFRPENQRATITPQALAYGLATIPSQIFMGLGNVGVSGGLYGLGKLGIGSAPNQWSLDKAGDAGAFYYGGRQTTGLTDVSRHLMSATGDFLGYAMGGAVTGGGLEGITLADVAANRAIGAGTSLAFRGAGRGIGLGADLALNSAAKTRIANEALNSLVDSGVSVVARRGAKLTPDMLDRISMLGPTIAEDTAAGRHINPNIVLKGTRHFGVGGEGGNVVRGYADVLGAYNARRNNVDLYTGGWLGSNFTKAKVNKGLLGVSDSDFMSYLLRHEFGHSADASLVGGRAFSRALRTGGRGALEQSADAQAFAATPGLRTPSVASDIRSQLIAARSGGSAFARAAGKVMHPIARRTSADYPAEAWNMQAAYEAQQKMMSGTWENLGAADMTGWKPRRNPKWMAWGEAGSKATPGSWVPRSINYGQFPSVGGGTVSPLTSALIGGAGESGSRGAFAQAMRQAGRNTLSSRIARSGMVDRLLGASRSTLARFGGASSFSRASTDEIMNHLFGGGVMPKGFEPGSPFTINPLSSDQIYTRLHGTVPYSEYLSGRQHAIGDVTNLLMKNRDAFGNTPFIPSDYEKTMALDGANLYTVGGPYASTARFHGMSPSVYYGLDLASRPHSPYPLPDMVTGTWDTHGIASHGAHSAGNRTSGSSVMNILQRLISGEDIVTPLVLMNEMGTLLGQQGRHRAFAADVLGSKIPIDVVSRTGRWTTRMIRKLQEFGLDFDKAQLISHPDAPGLSALTPNQMFGPDYMDSMVQDIYATQVGRQRRILAGMPSDSFGSGSGGYGVSSVPSGMLPFRSGPHSIPSSIRGRMTAMGAKSHPYSFGSIMKSAASDLARGGSPSSGRLVASAGGVGLTDFQNQLESILRQISIEMEGRGSSSIADSNGLTKAEQKLVDLRYQLDVATRGYSNTVPSNLSPGISSLDAIEGRGSSLVRSALSSFRRGGGTAFSRGSETWKDRVLGRNFTLPDSVPGQMGDNLRAIGPTVPRSPLSIDQFEYRNPLFDPREAYPDYLKGWRAMGKTVGKWHSRGVPKNLQYIPSSLDTILKQDEFHNAFATPSRTLLPDAVRRFMLPPEQYFAFDYNQRYGRFPVPDIMAASWHKGEYIGVQHGSGQSIQNIYERLMAGEDLVPPHIGVDETGQVVDQNGRHRAFTAAMLGMKQIPVDIRMSGGQWADEGQFAGPKLGIDWTKGVPINPRDAFKRYDLNDVRGNHLAPDEYKQRWGSYPSGSDLLRNVFAGGQLPQTDSFLNILGHGSSAFARGNAPRGGKMAAKDAANYARYLHNFQVMLKLASPADWQEGMLWYPREAGGITGASRAAGIRPDLGIHATAALSARQEWGINKRDALALIDAVGGGKPIPKMAGLPNNSIKAIAAIRGTPLSELYKSLKVPRFDANLLGQPDPVTIDTWMARSATHNFGVGFPHDHQYLIMESAIKHMAQVEGIEPRQMQSIIWSAIKANSNKSDFKMSFYDHILKPGNASAFARGGENKFWEGIRGSLKKQLPPEYFTHSSSVTRDAEGIPRLVSKNFSGAAHLADTIPGAGGASDWAGGGSLYKTVALQKMLLASEAGRGNLPWRPPLSGLGWDVNTRGEGVRDWSWEARHAGETQDKVVEGVYKSVLAPLHYAAGFNPWKDSAFARGLNVHQVRLSDFEGFAERSKFPQFLTPYSLNPPKGKEFAQIIPERFKAFKAKGLDAGYMLKLLDNGGSDIVAVHNNSKVHGLARLLLQDAIGRGGTNLDAYEGFLTKTYGKSGFREIPGLREPWNPEYAPDNWDYRQFGTPDVVYMRHQQSAVDRIRGRYRMPSGQQFASPFMQQILANAQHFYAGGVVKRPTLALMGEGHKTEAVFNSDQLRELSKFIGGGGSGGRKIEVHVHLHGVIADNETAIDHLAKRAGEMAGREVDARLRTQSG